MAASMSITMKAADTVMTVGAENLDRWAESKSTDTARMIADLGNQKLLALDGMLRIIRTITQERFRNVTEIFPNHYDSKDSRYPLKAKRLLPHPWEMEANVFWNQPTAAREHLRHRHSWFFEGTRLGVSSLQNLSTTHAVYQEYEHASNDTNSTIHRMVSDYASPLLKALFEHHGEVKSISIHFVNAGSVIFPARVINDTANTSSQVGCNWLRLPHPLRQDGRSRIGTPEQIAQCKSTDVGEFHVLQQSWCREQALEPNRLHVWGPSYDEDGHYQIQVGLAIYEHDTLDLLACTMVGVSAQQFSTTLTYLSNTGLDSHWGLVKWEDGTFLNTTTIWEADPVNRTTYSLLENYDDFGVTPELFQRVKQHYLHSYRDKGRFENFLYRDDRFYVGMYPFPQPPPLDSPESSSYEPYFLGIISSFRSERDEYLVEGRAQALVDNEVNRIRTVIIIAGLTSMGAIGVIVYLIALLLTSPLRWISRIGNEILECAGSRQATLTSDDNGAQQSISKHWVKKPWSYRLSPRTEVTRLVDEFQTMVEQFSGQGTAKVRKQTLFELKNPFVLQSHFQRLLEKRDQVNFVFSRGGNRVASFNLLPTTSVVRQLNFQPQSPQFIADQDRVHWGPNCRDGSEEIIQSMRFRRSFVMSTEHRNLLQSYIFWWICCCVALPLCLCMVGIATYVLVEVADSLPSLVRALEESYTNLERLFMLPYVHLQASFVSESLQQPMRDLYVLNRIAGWLFAGTVSISDTFTEMYTTAEKCKDYPFGTSCPAAKQSPASTCDCKWNDSSAPSCRNYTDSRRAQQLFFEGLSEDAFPNGDRNFTSYPHSGRFYPQYGDSPQNTFFWENIGDLPGSDRRYNSSGIETTYDRLRTASALAVVQIPLYNYVEGKSELSRTWSSSVTFEADGMTSGYSGCSQEHSHWAHFRHAESKVVGLCPPGKYG